MYCLSPITLVVNHGQVYGSMMARESMCKLALRMAYRYGQKYESSVHNIKGIIKTSKVHTIYQSSTKYIKLGNLISKCAHKISTTVTRSSNMKGSGSNQSENCRSCNFLRRKSGDVSVFVLEARLYSTIDIFVFSPNTPVFKITRSGQKYPESNLILCVFYKIGQNIF